MSANPRRATPESKRPIPDHRSLWAKSEPLHPLWKHLIDVAAVSSCLPNPVQRWGWVESQVALVTGLHDIGKADACFQHQVASRSDGLNKAGFPKTSDEPCRHERLSARFIRAWLRRIGVSAGDADTIGRSVIAHHGHWDEGGRDVAEEYRLAQAELCQMLREVLGVADHAMPPLSDHSAFGMRLAGHIVLCDWIASNDSFFQDDRLKGCGDPETYFARAKEVAEGWVGKLGLLPTRREGSPTNVVGNPRPIQRALLDNEIPPGLVIIEAPMGEGKTEAAWILAEKWRVHGYSGMYMALPTMATSDSLHNRYREHCLGKMARGEKTHLVHGMAWLLDDKETDELPITGEPGDDRTRAAAWFRPTRRAMLAAHGVGTVDQAMLAGMHVKFGFLRLFGLADRVSATRRMRKVKDASTTVFG